MTGHRKAFSKPLAAIAVVQRSYASFERRLEVATTPAQRVAAAMSYLQAASSRATPELAEPALAELFDSMVNTAVRLDADTAAAALVSPKVAR